MEPTNIAAPDYFHKVVDCQWACPAHTPVPEYIRLIAAGRYSDAYMINWKSNVFPGVLGRTCDRPCEPACRRGRVEKEPVAICRLKRVAADYKGDIRARLPRPAAQKQRQAHRAGRRRPRFAHGGARSRAARLPLRGVRRRPQGGRHDPHADPAVPPAGIGDRRGVRLHPRPRRRVPRRTPASTASRRCWPRISTRSSSAPARRAGATSTFPAARRRRPTSISASTGSPASRSATSRKIGRRVIVLGGGNTAMDCCRSSRRLGGEEVKVVVRSGFEEMKASPWEKEDAMHEGIPILNFLVPKEFTHDNGRLTGVIFEKVKAEYDAKGRRNLVPSGEPDQHVPCDDVLVAVGQENSFPWIERDIGIEFDKWDMPKVDPKTMRSTQPEGLLRRRCRVRAEEHHLGGRARPRGRAVDRHDAVRRGHRRCARCRPSTIVSQKMGIHEWSYDNEISRRPALPGAAARQGGGARRHQGRGRARLRLRSRAEGGRALPQLRHPDGVHRPRCASSATPASTSARWTASPSRPNAPRPSCAPASRRPRTTCPRTSTSRTASRPAASWPRTRTSACTAACAPSVAPPARGT